MDSNHAEAEALTSAQEELRRRTAELERVRAEFESFSRSISHDLRSPLQSLDFLSYLLQAEHSEGLTSEGKQLVGRIRQNVHAVGEMFSGLSEYSRVLRHTMAPEQANLAELAQAALKDLQSEMQGRDITVDIGELPTAICDPAMLKQLFSKLLSNAIRFTRTRDQARVSVRVYRENGEEAVCIEDNGVGFDMRHANQLFTLFGRLPNSDLLRGAGIGLAIAHKIVSRHQGRIWLHAKLDEGAKCCFTLGRLPSE